MYRKRPEVVIVFCAGRVATEAELELIDACRMFNLNVVNVQNLDSIVEGDAVAAVDTSIIPAEYDHLPTAKELWERIQTQTKTASKRVGDTAPVFELVVAADEVAPVKPAQANAQANGGNEAKDK